MEEDTLKDFLERRERGELLIQKSSNFRNGALAQIDLSVSRDGKVRFGDTVTLINPSPKDKSRPPSALSVNINSASMSDTEQGVSASHTTDASSRTALTIASADSTPDGSTLKYGQAFYLCNQSKMYLHSDRATFGKSAKKSRHNPVAFVSQPSHLTEWTILPFDPQYRMEMEFTDVVANQKCIVVHVKTNQDLCLESEYSLRTVFGMEYEVSTFTRLDTHKAEDNANHWVITMQVPGDNSMPAARPPTNP